MISEPHLKYWGLNGIWAPKGSMISKPHQKIGGSMIFISPAKHIGGLNDIWAPPPPIFFGGAKPMTMYYVLFNTALQLHKNISDSKTKYLGNTAPHAI